MVRKETVSEKGRTLKVRPFCTFRLTKNLSKDAVGLRK